MSLVCLQLLVPPNIGSWVLSLRLDGTRRILDVVFAHGDLRSDDGVRSPDGPCECNVHRTTAHLLFSRQAFELVFNLTDFTTTNGVRFANAAQQGRVYSLINLNCSDHGRGTAAPNGTVVPAPLTSG